MTDRVTKDAKWHERSAKSLSRPNPAFPATGGNIQIKEILRGQWDLLGREMMEPNSRREN